nr:hypothetical protein [Pararhodobacter sp.]
MYLFVAIDRTRKFAVTHLVDTADRKTVWEFLEHVLTTVPDKIHPGTFCMDCVKTLGKMLAEGGATTRQIMGTMGYTGIE